MNESEHIEFKESYTENILRKMVQLQGKLLRH